jgi:hypothetical protein
MDAELECRPKLVVKEGRMVLCHAAPKQSMLLPLKTQGGKVEKGRCQECRRDRTAQARGKLERLRQGASGGPPIRSPANGATVPPSGSSAKQHHPPPLNLSLTTTHGHTLILFGRGEPSCGFPYDLAGGTTLAFWFNSPDSSVLSYASKVSRWFHTHGSCMGAQAGRQV